jgi:hypothetical protein
MKVLFIAAIAILLTGCSSSTPTYTPTNTPRESTLNAPTNTPSEPAPNTPTSTTTAEVFQGRLLFARFIEASHTFTGMYISKTDGSGETAVPLPWTEGGGRWSMSGKEIAVPTLLEDGRVGTAIIATDGSVLRVLSIPDTTLNLPCTIWSRDDTRLACEGWDDSDPSRTGIYTVSASDGSDIQRLTIPPASKHDLPGDYSSDGEFVFIRHSGDEGPGPLMLVDANGGEPRVLYDDSMEDPGRFSPDGRFVATSKDGSLLIIDLDGKIVHEISVSGAFVFGPVWSPDGTRIAFSGTTSGYHAEIYTSLPDGSDLQRVTNTASNEIAVDWGVDSE